LFPQGTLERKREKGGGERSSLNQRRLSPFSSKKAGEEGEVIRKEGRERAFLPEKVHPPFRKEKAVIREGETFKKKKKTKRTKGRHEENRRGGSMFSYLTSRKRKKTTLRYSEGRAGRCGREGKKSRPFFPTVQKGGRERNGFVFPGTGLRTRRKEGRGGEKTIPRKKKKGGKNLTCFDKGKQASALDRKKGKKLHLPFLKGTGNRKGSSHS